MKLQLPNKEQVKQFTSSLAEKSLVVLVILYVAVSVGRSVMKNYQINQKIAGLEQELVQLDQEIDYLEGIIAYYKTDTFKELKAREELGLHAPGEIVLSVPLEEEDLTDDSSYLAIVPVQTKEKPLPNYQKWWRYFFGT
jgi:cell division protein FtsB